MKAYDFETWDVFTDKRFAGNPLAVVMDARGLSDETMQAVTREFNLSETVFVLPPENPAHAARLRIFTPRYELPFAGHPTVGAAIAIARARKLTGSLKLELQAGVFPIKVDMDGAAPAAEFENPTLPAERGAAPASALIEAALTLEEGAVDRDAHRPRCIGAGVDYIYARAPLAAVKRAKINAAAWDALALGKVVGVFLYAEGGEARAAAYHARMFAPGAGVAEDPATGSAAAALPGQIALSETLADGPHRWIVEQGFEMGRPSRIRVAFDATDGAIGKVSIGGSAVAVSKGQIFV